MKVLFCLLCFLFFNLIFISPNFFCKETYFINRIDGLVYDQSRNPIDNVYVELLNSVDSAIGRTKTNASGHFTFLGVPAGRFTINILPQGKGFLQDSQEVEINNQISRSDTVFVEFHLRADRKSVNLVPEGAPEVVFAQDIPKDALKLYEASIKQLDKNQDKGILGLEEAVKIFPTYFNALNMLGKEYISKKDYAKAYTYLIKAIDVNQRNYSTYYSLGYALYQLKEIPAALKAAEACVILNAGSPNIQLLYGTLLRINKDYVKAETALLKAKSLTKNPNPAIHWQLALLYNQLNRNKEAAEQLEIYLKLDPDSPEKKQVKELIAKLKTAS